MVVSCVGLVSGHSGPLSSPSLRVAVTVTSGFKLFSECHGRGFLAWDNCTNHAMMPLQVGPRAPAAHRVAGAALVHVNFKFMVRELGSREGSCHGDLEHTERLAQAGVGSRVRAALSAGGVCLGLGRAGAG
eukprot:2466153-Rhodomonas_salina.4